MEIEPKPEWHVSDKSKRNHNRNISEKRYETKNDYVSEMNIWFSEFKDAFELFDRTGDGIVAWDQCAPLARCFGYNPSEYTLKG